MNRVPRKPTDGSVETEDIQPKIMTQPLPMILDELENYIKRVEEAVKQAQAAARDSREAAAQAKESGEKAAEAARKAAQEAVAKVEKRPPEPMKR
jgi:colicin import membrane protein